MPFVPGLAVYVHWPFCRSKCPYCDFNSQVAENIDQHRWQTALLRELAYFAEETRERPVSSLFFGGGTPSLMQSETVAALIAEVRCRWPLTDGLEITLEANPTSADAGRFRAFREAGVNRLSVGVQSFDDQTLGFLGRRHTAAEGRAAIDLAAKYFCRFSFDLIYGRPGQTAAAWQKELGEALSAAGEHLSLYQLGIEPGTEFHCAGIKETDDETAAALYDATQDILAAAGLPAYEISNHARPGGECRHNLGYWLGGDYLGLGPGAHGRLTGNGRTEAVQRIGKPESWLAAVEEGGHGTAKQVHLGPQERLDEMVMMGLRLTEGIRRERFSLLAGRQLEEALDAARLDHLIGGGFLILDGVGLRATAAGRRRLNAVLAELLV
jgi:oxygen-independent coproporphyrinogen-3 oxidase